MKILSLNGGGTGGYGTALFLNQLEKIIGTNLYKEFDLITGVSTGSLIGSALALGKSSEEIKELYEKLTPKVFKKPSWWKLWKGITAPKYDLEILKRSIIDELGEIKISACKTKFMAYALEVYPKIKPKFWKSWCDDVKIHDVCSSSSAAPSYFKPYFFNESYFIDGGLLTAQPSVAAIAEALALGNKLEDIKLLNIRVSSSSNFDKNQADDIEGYLWLLRIPNIVLGSAQAMSEYESKHILGKNFKQVDLNIPTSLDDWDDDSISIMKNKTNEVIDFKMAEIIEFLN